MNIISLGGIGGCDLAHALRNLNQPAYPYDWMITTQSFVINSFDNINNFFIFDEKYVYDSEKLIMYNKKAVMPHDFKNFTLQKQNTIAKYKRRFDRLNTTLNNNEDILFVRIYDNPEEKLIPLDYYNDILIRDEEDISVWEKFINKLRNEYYKKITLLVISSNKDICNQKYNNIIMYHTTEHKNYKVIQQIIQDTVKSLS